MDEIIVETDDDANDSDSDDDGVTGKSNCSMKTKKRQRKNSILSVEY